MRFTTNVAEASHPVPARHPGETAEGSRLAAYMRRLETEQGLRFDGYHELWAWSVTELEAFWESLWREFGIEASRPYDRVLGRSEMPGAEWFPGAELSYVQHIFRGRDDGAVAIVHASELRPQAEVTWGELSELTGAIAGGLRGLGVGPGDRIAGYLPSIPEAVAAFFACASIGATWSCCSPDFGVRTVVDRFAQIEPKVLFCVDGYRYGGRDFPRGEVVAELARQIAGARTYCPASLPRPQRCDRGNAAVGDSARAGAARASTQLPFDHPLWVLYSSGTTGLPKAIVHGQGGILLEHLKALHFHTDARPGDRLFWFTTTGWMMWNYLVGGLLTDTAIVLYDGSPTDVLWDLAESAGITCFGTSAAYIHTCLKAGVEPAAGRDLSRLRAVGSTGSPLSPAGFRWVYDSLGEDTWLFSMSGGTDVCTAFVGGVPGLPVYEGELQARALGAKVEAFDEHGRPLIGEVGELVLTEPLPSMPTCLWNDPDGARYREAYFSIYPGVWRHGDWIEITERGTAVIHGRSDATINRGGVRMGTGELYAAVLAIDEIADALAVDADGSLRLFVEPTRRSELERRTRGGDQARVSARTARRATCQTRSAAFPPSRARSRESSSRCR